MDTCGGSSPSLSKEADRIRFSPGGQVLGRVDLLLHHADEVVDVVQPVVLDVQGMPAEPRTVREQHALRAGGGYVHQRADGVGAVADVHRLRLGHLGGAGEVDIAVAGRGQLRPRRGDDLQRGPVIEREARVVAGLGEPQVHQLAELVRVLGGQVVQLGAVGVGVVQLPGVVVEVAPAADASDGW